MARENLSNAEQSLATTGRGVLRALLGAYQSARGDGDRSVVPRAVREPRRKLRPADRLALCPGLPSSRSPIAMDLETASAALEAYLG